MHDSSGSNNFASEHLADTLMAWTDTKHRYSRAEMADNVVADPGVIWCTRPRRNTNSLRLHLFDFFNRSLIISSDSYLRTKFSKMLNQVVRKRIVIIDDEDHTISLARSMARNVAIALLTLS